MAGKKQCKKTHGRIWNLVFVFVVQFLRVIGFQGMHPIGVFVELYESLPGPGAPCCGKGGTQTACILCQSLLVSGRPSLDLDQKTFFKTKNSTSSLGIYYGLYNSFEEYFKIFVITPIDLALISWGY